MVPSLFKTKSYYFCLYSNINLLDIEGYENDQILYKKKHLITLQHCINYVDANQSQWFKFYKFIIIFVPNL